MGDHFFWNGWIEVCLVILAVNKIVYGHRMLDIDVDSIVSQLKNKVSYRLQQTIQGAVNDPEANQYAKEKAELKSSVDTGDELDEIPANLSSFEKMIMKMKRIAHRIKDRMTNMFITFIIPLILAMFVANESVMYPAPVRIIYFVFTFVLCYLNQAAVALLGTIYLGRFAYDYYVNKIEKRDEKLIVPPILSVLPIRIFDPSATPAFFKDLINYPLIYPRNERGEKNLLVIMNHYLESLKSSFTYLDSVKSMPMFVEKLKKIDENMEQLHKPIPEPIEKNENNQDNSIPQLPRTISEQREKNGLPPLNASESNQNTNRPLPLTIAEQREKNATPTISEQTSEKNSNQNVKTPLPPTVAELQEKSSSETQNNTNNTENKGSNVATAEPKLNINQNNANKVSLPPTIAELQAKNVNKRKPLPPVNT